jgi:hypothetical protein
MNPFFTSRMVLGWQLFFQYRQIFEVWQYKSRAANVLDSPGILVYYFDRFLSVAANGFLAKGEMTT